MDSVKKTPIGQIGKNQKKLTIAEEIEHESTYRFEPSLTPEQLFSCWLDPSERTMAETKCSVLRVDKTKARIPEVAVEALRQYLVPEATILLALAIALIVVACVVTYAVAKTQTEKD